MCENILYFITKSSEKPKFNLTNYADATFSHCIISQKTTERYLFCLNSAPLTWQSKKQSIIITFTIKKICSCL